MSDTAARVLRSGDSMTLRAKSILITGGLGYASSRAPEARRESQPPSGLGHQRRPYGAALLPASRPVSRSGASLR